MNILEKEPTLISQDSKIILQISALFESYRAAFIDLVVGKRNDTEILLQYYSAPLRVIDANFHLVIQDDATIISKNAIGGEIEKLRTIGFANSVLDECQISVLNARAAMVDTVWSRYNESKSLLARLNVAYLMGLTTDGWRITTVINKPLNT